MHGLVICSQDNIKRVIEFLIHQKILREAPQDAEMNKLWNKSWESIGAFFKDMKSSILSHGSAENQQRGNEEIGSIRTV